MWKLIRILWSLVLVLSLVILGALVADKQVLRENFVRMHIRADSDSTEDQKEKLAVRDSLLAYLSEQARNLSSKADALSFLQQNLGKLQACANRCLAELGSDNLARFSLRTEAFDTRDYDDFSLPAGVYDALVVEIGSGQGRNWWCVVFPAVCLQDFHTAAAAVDMGDDMENTLSRSDGYEIRFFFLECLGKLENFFHKS